MPDTVYESKNYFFSLKCVGETKMSALDVAKYDSRNIENIKIIMTNKDGEQTELTSNEVDMYYVYEYDI